MNEIQLLLGLVVCLLLALALVWFQYYFRSKRKNHWPAFFRVLAWLGLLLLIWNPEYISEQGFVQKQHLILLADNSASLKRDQSDSITRSIAEQFLESPSLKSRFELHTYAFDKKVRAYDSLNFEQQGTDIFNALNELSKIFNPQETQLVLLTDGIQTEGRDYQFGHTDFPSVYPVVLGDTTRYQDLFINTVNVNNYAFLGNEYPVEILLSYQGDDGVSKRLEIRDNGRLVFGTTLDFGPDKTSTRIAQNFEAAQVGLHRLEVRIEALEAERNTNNNVWEGALQVIDEKSRIGLISSLTHPDLGVLKRSIEVNPQREVVIHGPGDDFEKAAIDIWLLYQPDRNFEGILNYLQTNKDSYFLIGGLETDWTYLNQHQSTFTFEPSGPEEAVSGLPNGAFSFFAPGELNPSFFPPLQMQMGNLTIGASYETLFEQQIKGIPTGEPLLFLTEENNQKQAILLAENIWKWRLAAYRESNNHLSFDELMSKIVRFLDVGNANSRIVLEYESRMAGATEALIRARYFDRSMVFDPSANLVLRLKSETNAEVQQYPMLLKNGFYQWEAPDLTEGLYSFEVVVQGEEIRRSGSFTFMETQIESLQFTSDKSRLQNLANNTSGRLIYPDQVQDFINSLTRDPAFRPIQKSQRKVVSLIDFYWLLGLIVVALAGEWFIRKYHGEI